MPVIKFKHFDTYRASGVLRGVFLGGCVDRGDGSSFRARAHAHNAGDNIGWICIRSRRRLMAGRKPSNTMLHELAHLISGQGHTDKFRAVLRSLGGRCTLNAKKRKRGPVQAIYCAACGVPSKGMRRFTVHVRECPKLAAAR